MPIASSTTVRWGNTAGFTGLVYLVMASSSYSHRRKTKQNRNKPAQGLKKSCYSNSHSSHNTENLQRSAANELVSHLANTSANVNDFH